MRDRRAAGSPTWTGGRGGWPTVPAPRAPNVEHGRARVPRDTQEARSALQHVRDAADRGGASWPAWRPSRVTPNQLTLLNLALFVVAAALLVALPTWSGRARRRRGARGQLLLRLRRRDARALQEARVEDRGTSSTSSPTSSRRCCSSARSRCARGARAGSGSTLASGPPAMTALPARGHRGGRDRRVGHLAHQLRPASGALRARDDGRGVLRDGRAQARRRRRPRRLARGDVPEVAQPLPEPHLDLGARRAHGRVLLALHRAQRALPRARMAGARPALRALGLMRLAHRPRRCALLVVPRRQAPAPTPPAASGSALGSGSTRPWRLRARCARVRGCECLRVRVRERVRACVCGCARLRECACERAYACVRVRARPRPRALRRAASASPDAIVSAPAGEAHRTTVPRLEAERPSPAAPRRAARTLRAGAKGPFEVQRIDLADGRTAVLVSRADDSDPIVLAFDRDRAALVQAPTDRRHPAAREALDDRASAGRRGGGLRRGSPRCTWWPRACGAAKATRSVTSSSSRRTRATPSRRRTDPGRVGSSCAPRRTEPARSGCAKTARSPGATTASPLASASASGRRRLCSTRPPRSWCLERVAAVGGDRLVAFRYDADAQPLWSGPGRPRRATSAHAPCQPRRIDARVVRDGVVRVDRPLGVAGKGAARATEVTSRARSASRSPRLAIERAAETPRRLSLLE